MPTKYKIIPNSDRVLLKNISPQEASMSTEGGLIIPGQLKAGENLFIGEIIEPGQTKFKKGQRVYYSEYSAAALWDLGKVIRGEMAAGEAMRKENTMVVVAEDDIMAYEEVEDDTGEVSTPTDKGKSEVKA